jgi:O-antigen/teichoic acid export membrane protein
MNRQWSWRAVSQHAASAIAHAETRSVLANYAHLITGGAIFLVLTPVILHALGPVTYGYWVIVNSIGGYLLLADLGLSAAVARHTAIHRASGTADSLSRLLSTLAAVCIGSVLLVLAATAATAPRLALMFDVPAGLESTVTAAFVLTGVNAAAVLLTFFVASINYGANRLDVTKGASILGQVVMAAATVYLLRRGQGVMALAAATLAGTLASLGVNAIYLRTTFPDVRINPMWFDRDVFAETWRYGMRTCVLSICNRLVNYTDAIVIGAFVGAAAVASYELTYKVCFFATYLFSSLSTAAFPRFSASTAAGDEGAVQGAYLGVVRLSMLIAVPVGICLAAFLQPLLTMWAGPGMFAGTAVLAALMVMHLLHAIGTPGVMFLQSAGHNTELMYAEIGNAVLNVVLSILLVRQFGPAGVIAGTVAAHLCTTFWVIQRVPARMLAMRAADYWKTAVLFPLAVGVPAAALAAGFAILIPLHSPATLVLSCAGVCALYGLTYLAATALGRHHPVSPSEDSPWPIQSVS